MALVAVVVALCGVGTDAAVAVPLPVCPTVGQYFQTTWVIADCVQLGEGTFTISRPLLIPAGKTLRGAGIGKSVLTVSPDWKGNVMVLGHSTADVAWLENLTIDADGKANGGVGGEGLAVKSSRITGARCWGVAISGPMVSVEKSEVDHNGTGCPNAPPGAGIYANPGSRTSQNFAPRLLNNVIHDNNGPGVDIYSLNSGTFAGNRVFGHHTYAAVALYGASNWTIESNDIRHDSRPVGRVSHAFCNPGKYNRARGGAGMAAILLCVDDAARPSTDVVIRGNRVVSYYGILLIGADDVGVAPTRAGRNLVPRRATITGNNAAGSRIGCADDLQPSQVPGDDNVWRGNTCRGRANSGPYYF